MYNFSASSSVLFVLFSSTVALSFTIVFVSSSNEFTITLNVTVATPANSLVAAGTSTSSPSTNFSISCVVVPFLSTTVTSPSLIIVVPAGIVSLTFTIPAASPTFVSFIVYSIMSCSCKGSTPSTRMCSCGFCSLYIILLIFSDDIFATFVSGDGTSFSGVVPS